MISQLIAPLLLALSFFALYFEVGNLLLFYFILPSLAKLPSDWQTFLEPYLALDYGQVADRIFRFFWTLLLFFSFERIIHRTPLVKTILFNTKHKLWTLIRGAIFGATLIIALSLLSFLSHTITVTSIRVNVASLLSTVLLYAICTTLTSISTELALRGYILKHLIDKWGLHIAIWFSATLFGLMQLTVSPYYAYATFIEGILLGYAFAWHGIYYCIGWSFAWNFIESVVYSGKILLFQVQDPFLAGQKMVSPNQEGLLVLPILLIGFALLLSTHKTEWRLSEPK